MANGKEKFKDKHFQLIIQPEMYESGKEEPFAIGIVPPEVRKHFNIITNGHTSYEHRKIEENALRMYEPGLIIPATLTILDKVLILFPPPVRFSEYESVFDYGSLTQDFSQEYYQKQDVIEFYTDCEHSNRVRNVIAMDGVKKRWTPIGKFFPELRSLVTCDLPHSYSALPVLSQIIEYLVEKGFLDSKGIRKEELLVVEKKKTPKVTVTIGCDPEYEYINKEGRITESFPTSLFGNRGVDCGGHEEIGIDGSGSVLELRPKPEKAPSKLRDNVYNLMKKIKNHHLSVIGDKYPIGCHMHFGVGHIMYPPPQLIKLLDMFLGMPCYSMNGKRRGEYSGLGQYREQPHGFEYRSLPAAVTHDPEFFRIVAKMGKQIVERYVNLKPFPINQTNLVLAGETVLVPTRDTYKLVCGVTDNEISYFYKVIDTYRTEVSYDKSVIAFWKVEDAVAHKFAGAAELERYGDDRDYDDDDDDYDEPRNRTEEGRTIVQRIDFGSRTSELAFRFRESWNINVTNDIAVAVMDEVTHDSDLCGRFCTNTAVLELHFIGLRDSRGLVVHGFDIDYAPEVSSRARHSRINHEGFGRFNYGFSRFFRDDLVCVSDGVYYSAMLRALAKQIVRDLTEEMAYLEGAQIDTPILEGNEGLTATEVSQVATAALSQPGVTHRNDFIEDVRSYIERAPSIGSHEWEDIVLNIRPPDIATPRRRVSPIQAGYWTMPIREEDEGEQ